jgi:predicted ATPase
VDPLSAEETAAMTATLLGAPGEAGGLPDKILARAEGNPFFVEELARYLRESGDRAGQGDLPETVQALLAARIDRLAEPLKGVLQVAAVLGREFSLPLLQALAPGPGLADQVAELVHLELLREKEAFPRTVYSFAHLLVQEAAYQGLLLRARSDLHARAARALEALHADRIEDVAPDLAEHCLRSQDRDGAVRYLTLSGDRAGRLFAHDEAAAYYERALAQLAPDDTGGRVRVLGKLADAALARGVLPDARAHLAAALAGVGETGDRLAAAALHRKAGTAAWAAGDKAAAHRHLEAALGALGDDSANLEAAQLFQEFGRLHFRLGDHARAVEWARRALALGEVLGAPDVVSHAYNTWGVAVARSGDLEGGADLVRKSLEAALAHQLGAVACRAYTNLAVMYSSLDHERSAEYCREGLALAKRIGDQLQEAWLCCTLASGHCTLAGDYDEGVRAAETAALLDERLGQLGHLPIPLIILAQIHQCRGDYAEGERYYRRALAVAEGTSEPQLLVPCYEGLGIIAIEEGDEPAAQAWLDKSRSIQEATGWTSDAFQILPFLC